MNKINKKRLAIVITGLIGFSNIAVADDNASNIKEWFGSGDVGGALKSYYFSQTFDGKGKSDSQICVNGGNINFSTSVLNGFKIGGEFQGAYVTSIYDDDGKTAGNMDAEGAVLSESYLQYTFDNTSFKGGRQHFSSPLIANSGSRFIKESFEMYQIRNASIEDIQVSAGFVSKYQTRTDKSYYGDNAFVRYEENGTGRPGDFYDIGEDGMWFAQLASSYHQGFKIQAQYANVVDEVQAVYADIEYTLPIDLKSYVATQYYTSSWDDSSLASNDLYGVKFGASKYHFDIFAAYTTVSGISGESRVFRGLGQGAYYQYTSTTKTAGVYAFEAGTDSFQIGVGYKNDGLSGKLRYTSFDNPALGKDLDEWTINFLYGLDGELDNFVVSVDFSILDFEDNEKDATDLRTRLIYKF